MKNRQFGFRYAKDISSAMVSNGASARRIARFVMTLAVVFIALFIAGCESESDDCLNCVEYPPPVVPTGVHSISDDNLVIIQWYDISYHPYDGSYTPNVSKYRIYWRFWADGDQNNPNREFEFLDEVAWDENFDPTTGLHYYDDYDAVNGDQYEYAVSAVNEGGRESALSFELVTDAPLPMSITQAVLSYDDGQPGTLSGFDFSLLDDGVVDPNAPGTTEDIIIYQEGGIAYVRAANADVHIQDFGVFANSSGQLIFEGVGWAPADGYSALGRLELIKNHIYVVEIVSGPSTVHYAKFGVVNVGLNSVPIHWAYQSIEGLPELVVPEDDITVIRDDPRSVIIDL